MNRAKDAPRFRSDWSAMAAFVATVTASTAVVVLEIVMLAVLTGADDPVVVFTDILSWFLPLLLMVVTMIVILIGLPTWLLLHQLGVVHPGPGALVGAVMGAMVAGVLSLVLLSGFNSAGVFALFGVLPGAAGGGICLWVAYRP